jgi:arabinosyltransferase C
MIFAVFGGGLGFLVWHKFGRMIVSPRTTGFSSVFGGLLPVDVWQPEVGVFSSALTNGLFMISLTLMVVMLVSAIDAQQSWKSVIPGAVALGILMNIHSYDVMLIGLILLGFLITIIAQKEFSGIWLGRIAAMCAGIIPGAYWFLHTLATDPVFQERAATPTFSPNFRALLLGIFPAWALMLVALRKLPEGKPIAVSVFGAGTLGLAFALSTVGDFFPMTWAGFAISVICAGIVVWFGSRKCHFWNLMLAWAVFGILAPYAPVLFQRKLAAGLIIPFAILGALGLGELMKNMDRIQRNLLTTVLGVTLGMSSVMWLQRDALLIRDDVSTTTVQPAFLSEEMSKIISIISNTRIQDGDKDRAPNVVAVPGIPSPTGEPDRYARPYIVDMNPIVSGLAGAYTYAGHWSETPKYAEKRSETMRILFTGQVSSQEQISWLGKNKIDFVIAPNIKNYPDLPYRDLRGLGEIQLEGPEFLLIRLTR